MQLQNIPQHVHFVGIGGIGTSSLAQHLLQLGHIVTGSDRQANSITKMLQKKGIDVFVGHNAQNVGKAGLVVHTSAVDANNVELAYAHSNGIPTMLREELLGVVFNSFETRIAVCGTHGKTTVTAMIHHILACAGVEHTAFVGGLLDGTNYCFGQNVVVAEACEYNQAFLHLRPTVCLCLNAEFDHPDCYSGRQDVLCAFGKFVCNTPKDGVVILPQDLASLCNRVATKGIKTLQVAPENAQNVRLVDGKPTFVAHFGQNAPVQVQLNVLGKHNVVNALFAMMAALQVGVSLPCSAMALGAFGGVERRFNKKLTSQGYNVIVDYAHHPTEIACAIATAKSITKGNVLCVFQPHTYSRTKALLDDFAHCFAGVHALAILPTFSARETPNCGVDSDTLAENLLSAGANVCCLANFASTARWIRKNATAGDTVLLLGAGDVDAVATLLD